jgi:hypothetical protein
MYLKLVRIVQILLGADYLINGLNWWVKLIDDYPSIADFIDKPPREGLVGSMIKTGFMFHIVKAIEIAGGLAFLSNRFVPVMLVTSYSVSVNVFLVDVFMSTHLRAFIMGSGAMLMHTFLLLAYFRYYEPMLVLHAQPDTHFEENKSVGRDRPVMLNRQGLALARIVMPVLGALSVMVGSIMVIWLTVMIVQHFSQ